MSQISPEPASTGEGPVASAAMFFQKTGDILSQQKPVTEPSGIPNLLKEAAAAIRAVPADQRDELRQQQEAFIVALIQADDGVKYRLGCVGGQLAEYLVQSPELVDSAQLLIEKHIWDSSPYYLTHDVSMAVAQRDPVQAARYLEHIAELTVSRLSGDQESGGYRERPLAGDNLNTILRTYGTIFLSNQNRRRGEIREVFQRTMVNINRLDIPSHDFDNVISREHTNICLADLLGTNPDLTEAVLPLLDKIMVHYPEQSIGLVSRLAASDPERAYTHFSHLVDVMAAPNCPSEITSRAHQLIEKFNFLIRNAGGKRGELVEKAKAVFAKLADKDIVERLYGTSKDVNALPSLLSLSVYEFPDIYPVIQPLADVLEPIAVRNIEASKFYFKSMRESYEKYQLKPKQESAVVPPPSASA